MDTTRWTTATLTGVSRLDSSGSTTQSSVCRLVWRLYYSRHAYSIANGACAGARAADLADDRCPYTTINYTPRINDCTSHNRPITELITGLIVDSNSRTGNLTRLIQMTYSLWMKEQHPRWWQRKRKYTHLSYTCHHLWWHTDPHVGHQTSQVVLPEIVGQAVKS